MAERRVIILGGGFAGVKCARTLRKRLPRSEFDVVLFNQENHMVFHPLLAEVAGGSVNPEAVAAPLRQMLPGVRCRTEEVERVDAERRVVEFVGFDGRPAELAYDHVVLALGSVVNLGMVPGMSDHAFAMKTVGDAVALRAHVMQQLERAEVCDDAERRRWLVSFIVVGGGYSGVETAGEINDLARGSLRYFANIATDEVTVTVIHSRDQLLPEISPSLREFARSKMERAGIEVVLNARVTFATAEGVFLGDGRVLRGGTIVCTIGNTTSKVVQRLDVPKDRGRVRTEADMRVAGLSDVWAVGDCALVVNAHDGEPSPPTGQFAERQGRQAADNIVRAVRGEPTRPFSFKPVGQLCSIGHHNAVAEVMGMRLSGLLAWFLWRTIYLSKLPSWSRRAKVGFDWAWQLVFSRDLSHLRTDTTERVTHAHYQPGDFVFHEGDPASSFYAIESGEVEIVVESRGGEVVAVLGPGDFFGEMALVRSEPRSAGVRARSELEVVVMGKRVFEQVSGSLSVLRDLVTDAVRRRSGELWASLPAARRLLAEGAVAELLEPPPERTLAPDDTLGDALELFARTGDDVACVVDANGRFQGVFRATGLFGALEEGARRATPIAALVDAGFPRVRADDRALVAAESMRERNLKWLPVVAADGEALAGVVRAERLVGHVLSELPVETPA